MTTYLENRMTASYEMAVGVFGNKGPENIDELRDEFDVCTREAVRKTKGLRLVSSHPGDMTVEFTGTEDSKAEFFMNLFPKLAKHVNAGRDKNYVTPVVIIHKRFTPVERFCLPGCTMTM